MSHIAESARHRGAIDRVGMVVTASVLVAFACIAMYGLMSGFTATKSYEASIIWVGGSCAALCALCGLYIMLEWLPPANVKLGLFFLVICGFAGYYATIAGAPAIATERAGNRGEVLFGVTSASMPWGSKSCNYAVVAVNPDYAELRFCADTMTPRPRVGDSIRLAGFVSAWGIKAESTTVLR
jgi:hypothetical protein